MIEVHTLHRSEYYAFVPDRLEALNQLIQEELAIESPADWAGEYRLPGDDFGETMRVSPRGRFSWYSFSNGGERWNHGWIKTASRDEVVVDPAFDPTVFPTGPDLRFFRCTWRGMDYLVPDSAMHWFLNQINGHDRVALVL